MKGIFLTVLKSYTPKGLLQRLCWNNAIPSVLAKEMNNYIGKEPCQMTGKIPTGPMPSMWPESASAACNTKCPFRGVIQPAILFRVHEK